MDNEVIITLEDNKKYLSKYPNLTKENWETVHENLMHGRGNCTVDSRFGLSVIIEEKGKKVFYHSRKKL